MTSGNFQSQFHSYCLIWVSKKLFSQALRFQLCSTTSKDNLLQLLKVIGYQESYLFFKLSKHVFLLTAAFNKQLLITCSGNSASTIFDDSFDKLFVITAEAVVHRCFVKKVFLEIS